MQPIVFYDGNCLVCHTEINFYKKNKNSNLINWVDISAPGFNAVDYGLENFPFKKKLYAKKDKEFLEGLDTFAFIWQTLNIFSSLLFLIKFKPIRWLMQMGYNLFVIIRPYLPKRNRCKDNYCER